MATCSPAILEANAKCFACLSEKDLLEIITYALAVKAGLSTNPTTLLALANNAGYQNLSEKDLLRIQAFALCQILG